ncbi:TPA: HK97 gp10 family phage protein, partial [Staphylococcus aureus]|nr:HK97 gp10 family phage protein [Staphylococcus aureus]
GNAIIKAGAMSLVPLLKSNTPFADTKKHAREHIGVSNVKTDRDSSEKIVTVGYTKGVSHRIHATEFGTMYQSPQLFITKTEKQGKDKVLKTMIATAKRLQK